MFDSVLVRGSFLTPPRGWGFCFFAPALWFCRSGGWLLNDGAILRKIALFDIFIRQIVNPQLQVLDVL